MLRLEYGHVVVPAMPRPGIRITRAVNAVDDDCHARFSIVTQVLTEHIRDLFAVPANKRHMAVQIIRTAWESYRVAQREIYSHLSGRAVNGVDPDWQTWMNASFMKCGRN